MILTFNLTQDLFLSHLNNIFKTDLISTIFVLVALLKLGSLSLLLFKADIMEKWTLCPVNRLFLSSLHLNEFFWLFYPFEMFVRRLYTYSHFVWIHVFVYTIPIIIFVLRVTFREITPNPLVFRSLRYSCHLPFTFLLIKVFFKCVYCIIS